MAGCCQQMFVVGSCFGLCSELSGSFECFGQVGCSGWLECFGRSECFVQFECFGQLDCFGQFERLEYFGQFERFECSEQGLGMQLDRCTGCFAEWQLGCSVEHQVELYKTDRLEHIECCFDLLVVFEKSAEHLVNWFVDIAHLFEYFGWFELLVVWLVGLVVLV